MGCDIHMFIEKRLRSTDPWQLDEHHVKEPDESYLKETSCTGRNYEMFGAMAGVRRPDNAIFEERGIPSDVSPELKEEASGPDWHSHSWLTPEEFKQCLDKCDYSVHDTYSTEAFYDGPWDKGPGDYTPIYRYCMKWLEEHAVDNILLGREKDPAYSPEIRLVFWFDN